MSRVLFFSCCHVRKIFKLDAHNTLASTITLRNDYAPCTFVNIMKLNTFYVMFEAQIYFFP
jgi:hypothetical protein